MGGLVEADTIRRLEDFAKAGGLVVFGPKGVLATLDDPRAGYALMGIKSGAGFEAGGQAALADGVSLKCLPAGRQFVADSAVADPDGQVLAGRCGPAACLWRRIVGKGAVLVCLGDQDDLILPAFLSVAEELGGFDLPDARADGVMCTQLGQQILLFNHNDAPVKVQLAGQTVELEAYDELAMPLKLVAVPRTGAGPDIQSLNVRQLSDGAAVELRATGTAGGAYVELRRGDYRTVYADLKLDGSTWKGTLPTPVPGRYLLTAYVLDAKGRPSAMRRLEATI